MFDYTLYCKTSSSSPPMARHYNSTLSIWLSVDPMSDKYPGTSPYTYCANNPVRLVDPNGREIYIIGSAYKEAFRQIKKQTSIRFRVRIDSEGKMKYKGKARTEIDKLIRDAIDDGDIAVNILADNSNSFGEITTKDGGAYMGNSYEDGKVCTDQYVAPSMLADFDRSVGDRKPGLTMIHELAESYFGGQIALGQKQSSPYAVEGENDMSTYNDAHFRANQIAIGNRGKVLQKIPFRHNPEFRSDLPISPKNPPIIPGETPVWTGRWLRITNKDGM